MTLTLDAQKVVDLSDSMVAEHLPYKLGGKIDPLSLQAFEVHEHGIAGVDCSGFVRWLLYHALGQPPVFGLPDGSVQQHEWVQAQGFTPCDAKDGHLLDDVTRIAFLPPEATTEGIGHVLITLNGVTHESYGHHGPGSREWGSEAFMGHMVLFVLGRKA